MVLLPGLRSIKPNNAIQSLRPLTYISWLSAAPFQYTLSADKKVRSTILSTVMGIVLFLYYMSYTIYWWEKNSYKLHGYTTMCSIFAFGFIMRKKLVSVMQKIIIVDEIFLRLGVKLKHQRILWFSFLFSMGIMIFHSVDLGIDLQNLGWHGYRVLSSLITIYTLPQLNVSLLILKFLFITRLVHNRFRMVNEILQDMVDAETDQDIDKEQQLAHSTVYVNSVIHQNPQNTIKQVSKIHSLLCDSCETIDEYFSYPLLSAIGGCFLNLVFRIYYLMVQLFYNKDLDAADKYDYVLSTLMGMVSVLGTLFIIVEASSNTIGQSSSTAAHVHNILNIVDEKDSVVPRLFRFSLQLTHRKVSFNAAGLFSLDRTLLFTIAGAVTCYLIILCQFHAARLEAGHNSTDYIRVF